MSNTPNTVSIQMIDVPTTQLPTTPLETLLKQLAAAQELVSQLNDQVKLARREQRKANTKFLADWDAAIAENTRRAAAAKKAETRAQAQALLEEGKRKAIEAAQLMMAERGLDASVLQAAINTVSAN